MVPCWDVCTRAWNDVQWRESNPRKAVKGSCGPMMSLQCSKWRVFERWGHTLSVCLCQSLIVSLKDNETLWKRSYRAEPATSQSWQRLKKSLSFKHTRRCHNWPVETGLELKPALCKSEKWTKLQIKALLIQSMIILGLQINLDWALMRHRKFGRKPLVCVCVHKEVNWPGGLTVCPAVSQKTVAGAHLWTATAAMQITWSKCTNHWLQVSSPWPSASGIMH